MGGLGTHTRTLARPCAQPNAHAQCTRILTCAHVSARAICVCVCAPCAYARVLACFHVRNAGCGVVWLRTGGDSGQEARRDYGSKSAKAARGAH